MIERRSFLLRSADDVERIDTGPEIPSLFLLVGHASATHQSDDWGDYWPFPIDPVCRLGRLWPRGDNRSRQIATRLMHDKGFVLTVYDDMIVLGAMALGSLTTDEQRMLEEPFTHSGPWELTRVYPAPSDAVVCHYDQMPDDYWLPFVRSGSLVLSRRPARLIGFDVVT